MYYAKYKTGILICSIHAFQLAYFTTLPLLQPTYCIFLSDVLPLLIQHKLSILRDERTGVKEFREIVSEIAALECYEATRDLPMEDVEIKTPVAVGTFYTTGIFYHSSPFKQE